MNLESYPLEFVKPLKFSFEILGKCNVRFDDSDGPSLKKYLNDCFMLVCLVLQFASATKYVFEVFDENLDVADLAFSIPIYVFISQAIFKAVVLISSKQKIRFIINELGHSWRVENLSEVQTLKKKALLKKLEICQKTAYYTVMIGSYIYCSLPLIELFLHKFIWHQEAKPRLPYPCSYPFDPFQNWLLYAGLYVFQVCTTFCLVYSYIGTEYLMVALCSHISTELSLLQEDMRYIKPTLNNTPDEDVIEMTIEDFVKKHQRLLKLNKKLDTIFNKINFVIFLSATITICFFAIGTKEANGVMLKVGNYLAVWAMLIPLFIVCHYGEMLRVESVAIADAAYNNLWYTAKIPYQKAIALIIVRSQRPCGLTSLKYNPITQSTFTKVLSTTWSYFSLITSLYEDKN